MSCNDEGATHHEACDCTRERYRREGAAEERARVVAWLQERATALGARATVGDGLVYAAYEVDQAAESIERGEHVKGGG